MKLEKKVILVVADGLGDRPVKDGKTPLQLARKPNLDEVAREGICGMLSTVGRGVIPGSDTAHLALFGYDPFIYYRGRGPFEALGVGVELEPGDVAFRANFATLDGEEKVIDRRAGRLKEEGKELAQALGNLTIEGVKTIFISSTEHRGVLVLRGEGLSPEVSDTDPHTSEKISPLQARPLKETPEARRTARIVNKFTRRAREILSSHPLNQKRKREGKLPANTVLLRGAGVFEKVESLGERYGIKSLCIAGSALYRGVARYVGMEVLEVPGATGRVDTDVLAKAKAAKDSLGEYDFIFVHLKGSDNASHDGNLEAKIKMIEKLDQLVEELKEEDIYLVVTSDHSTPLKVRRHSADPVPLVIRGEGVRKDGVSLFDEISCSQGNLGWLTGCELMGIITDLMGCGKMVGS